MRRETCVGTNPRNLIRVRSKGQNTIIQANQLNATEERETRKYNEIQYGDANSGKGLEIK